MNESKNISDYDIILLPYIAEIIASDKLTDDQRELQLRAIFKLRSILKYYANRRALLYKPRRVRFVNNGKIGAYVRFIKIITQKVLAKGMYCGYLRLAQKGKLVMEKLVFRVALYTFRYRLINSRAHFRRRGVCEGDH